MSRFLSKGRAKGVSEKTVSVHLKIFKRFTHECVSVWIFYWLIPESTQMQGIVSQLVSLESQATCFLIASEAPCVCGHGDLM